MFTRKPRLQLKKFAINGAKKDFCNTICQERTHAPQQDQAIDVQMPEMDGLEPVLLEHGKSATICAVS